MSGGGWLRDAVDFTTACRLIATRIQPGEARLLPVASAVGAVTASPVVATDDLPGHATCLHEGYAVHSDALAGASPLMPIALPRQTPFLRQGEVMPEGFDALLRPEDCQITQAGIEALREATPGAGVMVAGERAAAGAVLLEKGVRLTPQAVATLTFAGIAAVEARRPAVAILVQGSDKTGLAGACAHLLAGVGADCAIMICDGHDEMASNLTQTNVDALFAIGDLEAEKSRLRDTLIKQAEILAPAIAIAPGSSAMLAEINGRFMLAMPASPEAVFALTLTFGRLIVAMLAGERHEGALLRRRLTKKIAGQAGLTRLVFVCVDGSGGVTPLGQDMMTIAGLARMSGLVVVPAGSEGFAEGTSVAILMLEQFLSPGMDVR